VHNGRHELCQSGYVTPADIPCRMNRKLLSGVSPFRFASGRMSMNMPLYNALPMPTLQLVEIIEDFDFRHLAHSTKLSSVYRWLPAKAQ
jgi:hypothetical protein